VHFTIENETATVRDWSPRSEQSNQDTDRHFLAKKLDDHTQASRRTPPETEPSRELAEVCGLASNALFWIMEHFATCRSAQNYSAIKSNPLFRIPIAGGSILESMTI